MERCDWVQWSYWIHRTYGLDWNDGSCKYCDRSYGLDGDDWSSQYSDRTHGMDGSDGV